MTRADIITIGSVFAFALVAAVAALGVQSVEVAEVNHEPAL